jgi:hypothetical protein
MPNTRARNTRFRLLETRLPTSVARAAPIAPRTGASSTKRAMLIRQATVSDTLRSPGRPRPLSPDPAIDPGVFSTTAVSKMAATGSASLKSSPKRNGNHQSIVTPRNRAAMPLSSVEIRADELSRSSTDCADSLTKVTSRTA